MVPAPPAGTVCGAQDGQAIAVEVGKPAANGVSPRSPSSPNPILIRSPACTRFSFCSVFVTGAKNPFQVYVTW